MHGFLRSPTFGYKILVWNIFPPKKENSFTKKRNENETQNKRNSFQLLKLVLKNKNRQKYSIQKKKENIKFAFLFYVNQSC